MRRPTLTGMIVSVLQALGGNPFVKGLASATALTLLTTSLTFGADSQGTITGVVRGALKKNNEIQLAACIQKNHQDSWNYPRFWRNGGLRRVHVGR